MKVARNPIPAMEFPRLRRPAEAGTTVVFAGWGALVVGVLEGGVMVFAASIYKRGSS